MEDPFKGNLDSSVIDAESLEKVPLEPFILPGSQCKASFPGKPHRASNDRKLFPAYAEFWPTKPDSFPWLNLRFPLSI